jgi:hypothetical protein
MTEFTEEQLQALGTLTLYWPYGIALSEDRAGDIATCETLVESGHAVRVESDDFEGRGYVLSEEMAEAHRQLISDGAAQAGLN